LTVRETPRSGSRVLILTASVGEGHDLPARTLAAQLRAERPDVEVVTRDGLAPMGRVVTAISADAARVVFFRFQWLWDVGFWVFAGFGPTRRATQALLARAGGAGLLRLIRSVDPQVVVSTYPTTTEVLARLRRSGALEVPVVSAITDVAALHYWAAPGVDVHLITHPESADEVRRIVDADTTSVEWVHGLTAAEFLRERSATEARDALGLPAAGKIVLVSGGGWGVGDVEGAAEEGLGIDEVSQVVCLCGRNNELRTRLARRFAADPRVQVEPFTERMPDWLAAADVLVHSTGGLTVLEALMRGCAAISYGWGRGHVRLHNAAFQRFGLAEVVGTRGELEPALRRALARGRTRTDAFRALPSAASVVLAAVEPR
jgi:processive 1,2-diacylglycerol beta-glucosyltransferase